jgi:uncharacterized protein YjbJ (UPF0337 family)/uncharacterized membrane protein (UPF0127 family)
MGDSLRVGERAKDGLPCFDMEPRRLRRLPRADIAGRRLPVVVGPRSRLLGLAFLRRERAGAGLLIPRCHSVHTFGMLFRLDLLFLDQRGRLLREVRSVPPFRVAACRGAAAVLELPACVYARQARVIEDDSEEGDAMSIIDKLTGRAKKAAGDIADDPSLRHEGRKEERKGEAKEKLGRAQDNVEDKAEEVADLERRT